MAFPDQATLDTFFKLSEFVLAIHGLKVRISKSNIDPAASSVLQSVWIKVCGVPNFAREDEIIKKIVSLVAEPIKVDEFSLVRDEPVRVRVNCRDPAKLKGFMEIFFNGIGYEIKFIAESHSGRNQNKGDDPHGKGNPNDKQGGGGGKDQAQDKYNYRGSSSGGTNTQNERNGESQGDSQEDSMEDLIRDGTPEYEQALETETSEEKVLLASVEIENLATSEKMGEGSQVANEDDLMTKMSVDDHALLDNPLLLSSQVLKTNGENFSPSFKPTGGVEVLISGLQEGRENMQSQKEGSLGIYPSKSLLHNSQGPKLIL